MTRFVLYGNSCIARFLAGILTRRLGVDNLYYARTLIEAETELWHAGDSSTLFDSVHLIHITPFSNALTQETVFRTHCRFRPSWNRSATLQGFGPGWAGGIIFVAFVPNGVSEFTELVPFSRLGNGNRVLPLPFELSDLMSSMSTVGSIYPERWKQELLALSGLASFRSMVLEAEKLVDSNVAQAVNQLGEAIHSLLADVILERLLAHAEVRGRIRQVLQDIENESKPSLQLFERSLQTAKTILADYI